MPIQHYVTLLCDSVIQDKRDRFSYLSSYENIELANLPDVMSRLAVVVSFRGDADQEFSIAVLDPGGRPVVPEITDRISAPPQVSGPYQQWSVNLVLELRNLVLQEEGIYRVEFRAEGRVVNVRPFGVFLRSEQGDGNQESL